MAKKVVLPKTQNEIFNGTPDKTNRALDIRRDDDTHGDLRIGLYDIDKCIRYYFDNVIRPTVIEDNETIAVSVVYGSPERWKAIQKEGYYRDKEGKIQCPLIVYRRTSITKDRGLARNVDANVPRVVKSFQAKYSQRNRYDAFSRLTNTKPTHEMYNVIIPDYVKISYECIIWTNYVEHNNKIIEAINYAESSYWGEKDKFQFYATVNEFTNATEIADGTDRMIKSSFNINLNGYIISDALQKQIVEHPKEFSPQIVKIKEQEDTTTIDKVVNNDPNTINQFRKNNPYEDVIKKEENQK